MAAPTKPIVIYLWDLPDNETLSKNAIVVIQALEDSKPLSNRGTTHVRTDGEDDETGKTYGSAQDAIGNTENDENLIAVAKKIAGFSPEEMLRFASEVGKIANDRKAVVAELYDAVIRCYQRRTKKVKPLNVCTYHSIVQKMRAELQTHWDKLSKLQSENVSTKDLLTKQLGLNPWQVLALIAKVAMNQTSQSDPKPYPDATIPALSEETAYDLYMHIHPDFRIKNARELRTFTDLARVIGRDPK